MTYRLGVIESLCAIPKASKGIPLHSPRVLRLLGELMASRLHWLTTPQPLPAA